jgi:nitrogen regulatory protein PII-like uncharacterized protein
MDYKMNDNEKIARIFQDFGKKLVYESYTSPKETIERIISGQAKPPAHIKLHNELSTFTDTQLDTLRKVCAVIQENSVFQLLRLLQNEIEDERMTIKMKNDNDSEEFDLLEDICEGDDLYGVLFVWKNMFGEGDDD